MKTYDHILQGHEATLENAISHAMGLDWQDIEQKEDGTYFIGDYVDSYNGIDIHYKMIADYYYFTDTTQKQNKMENNQATNNYIFFTRNYPNGWIDKVWPEDEWGSITNHMKEKFSGCYEREGSKGAVNQFYFELSGNHRQLLLNWVEENYNG